VNERFVPFRRVALVLLTAAVMIPCTARASGLSQAIAEADQVFQTGAADKALQQISSLQNGGADTAEALNLACRIHFALQQWDKAVSECEKATRLDNQNSAYHMWLGRALGLKAEHVIFTSAYGLGKRVLVEFETAARLNPRSPEALMDLGDFYKSAPGMIGGGLDKAESVAKQLDRIDVSQAHQLRGSIAEARGDYGAAEHEYKEAIATAQHPALRLTVLASFYRTRKRYSDMQATLHSAEGSARRDPHATVALYDGAGVLIDGKLDPGTAARMLEEYLASQTKTEEGPAFEAYVRLAKMKKQLGDPGGAQLEIAAALALAHDYKPALEFNR
jgi:tetratricopeptide (TPR) repeat protein